MTECPISSKRFKDSIEYLDGRGLQQLHDQTIGLRLATYHYKPEVSDPSPRHLGVIVEDLAESSPALGASRNHVDLYGYLSMVVATIQVQEQEIAELRRQLDEARATRHATAEPASRAVR